MLGGVTPAGRSDPYGTNLATPSTDVLEVPATGPVVRPTRESDQVLEDSFSALPLAFTQQSDEETGVAPESEIGEPFETPPRTGVGWLAAGIMIVAVLLAGAAYFSRGVWSKNGEPVASPGISSSPTAGDATLTRPGKAEGTPAPSATGPAVQPSVGSSPKPKSTATPLEGSVEVPKAQGNAPEVSQPESATRARAVNPETLRTGSFTLQVAAVPSEEEANRLGQRLTDAGLDVRIRRSVVGQSVFYRVRVGAFPTRAEAEQYGEQIRRAGTVDAYFVTDLRNQ